MSLLDSTETIDKNQAVIDFLLQCPQIQNSPLYFNFINAEDNDKQIVTSSNDVYLNQPYIDGSVLKRYTFTLLDFKSISESAIVTVAGYMNENVEDLADVQTIIDWVKEQNELSNFPDFGEHCVIQRMEPTTNNPHLEGINTEITPMLAMYSVSIEIDYIDTSKMIWR